MFISLCTSFGIYLMDKTIFGIPNGSIGNKNNNAALHFSTLSHLHLHMVRGCWASLVNRIRCVRGGCFSQDLIYIFSSALLSVVLHILWGSVFTYSRVLALWTPMIDLIMILIFSSYKITVCLFALFLFQYTYVVKEDFRRKMYSKGCIVNQ